MSAPAAAPAAWAGELATNRTVNAPAIEQAAGEFQQVTGQAVRAQDLASKNALQIIQRDLAKAHQRLQLSAWDRALRQLATAWPLLDFNDLDGTQRQWLAANLEIAQQAEGAAGRIAQRYLDNARVMAVGSPLGAQLDGLAGRPAKELAESMRLNGPVFIKTMMASGRPAASIEKSAFSLVMGDLMKSVMDIPRNATIESSWKDDQSTGVVWVTDGKPCDWCRKLAGWEAKAIQPGTGTGGHAHCGCVYQPSYQSAPTRRGSAKAAAPTAIAERPAAPAVDPAWARYQNMFSQPTNMKQKFDPANPLAFYGDLIQVADQSPLALRHLDDLAQLPQASHEKIRAYLNRSVKGQRGGIYVGDKGTPELDDFGRLRGVKAVGHGDETWDTVPGLYDPNTRKLALGGGGHGHGSASLAQHEASHALDDALGKGGYGRNRQLLTRTAEFTKFAGPLERGVGYQLHPYFTSAGNPANWRAEMFAESMAGYVASGGDALAIGKTMGRGADVQLRRLGQKFIDYFEANGLV